MFKQLPSCEELNRLFRYDPETGKLYHKLPKRGPKKPTQEAGSMTDSGYVRVKIKGAYYKAHRIIWKMVYGCDPNPLKEVDHINNIRSDNRIVNLQELEPSANKAKRKGRGGKKGYGTYFDPETNSCVRLPVEVAKARGLRHPRLGKVGPEQPGKQVQLTKKDTGEVSVWDSISAAARGLGLYASSVSAACHGRLKTTGGYTAVFVS